MKPPKAKKPCRPEPKPRPEKIGYVSQLDRARCPICQSPMTLRIERHKGHYFHCQCHERN
jgi:ssDNA-binding Zn-finger/Zn-ribbon topoisomerase 1